MRRSGFQIWYAVLGDELLDCSSDVARKEASRFTSRIVLEQGRADLPPYWIVAFETECSLHANILFFGTKKIADRLHRSFAPYMQGAGAIQPVRGANGLKKTISYLSKEGTQQAMVSCNLPMSTRRKGSHRLEGGGDRIRLSPALRRDAITAGVVEPWQRTNADRKTFAIPAPSILLPTKPAIVTLPAPIIEPDGQLAFFGMEAQPIITLTNYRSGRLPEAVAREIEDRRRKLGWSQKEAASRAGLSQPTWANAIRGHDGFSRHAVARLKTVLSSAA
ncbi:helix-turn-helix transcriptional regulator [Fulvimarina sp. MAC8]|uniref:helix-turn-helix domain-containing protein n=1 Tax=Fulvimarina sp. MAC8 TaxID=3162874 RepID=UPI0032EB9536